MSKTIREMFDELIMAVPFTNAETRYIPKIKVALEKQIPKKPIKIERQPYFRKHYSKSFTCPICNNSILGTGRPYCAFCGQALDWGDTE